MRKGGPGKVSLAEADVFYQTRLDENTWILLDAESHGAFAKSELESDMTPATAFENTLELAHQVARAVSAKLSTDIDPRMAVNFDFSIKVDAGGNVMIAPARNVGQFSVTVRWSPTPFAQ
jgi:hypothetical protein